MFKIIALTDVAKDEAPQEDETITQVTKEAQVIENLRRWSFFFIFSFVLILKETIAVSEYMRALSLKQNGNPDFALGLFEDLLRTQVLADVSLFGF